MVFLRSLKIERAQKLLRPLIGIPRERDEIRHQENLGPGLFSTPDHQPPDIIAHASTLGAMGLCLAGMTQSCIRGGNGQA